MKDYFLESRGIAYRTNQINHNKPTLLFIHGLSGSSAAWAPYEETFSLTHNVITFDLRGHGLSLRPRLYKEYDMAYFIEDIHTLLMRLGVGRTTCVSHSYGTLIAMEFLRVYPTFGSKALFISPVFGVQNSPLVSITNGTFELLSRVTSANSVAPHRHSYSFTGTESDWSLSRLSADLRTTGLFSYGECIRHLYDEDRDPHWKNLRLPTRIIHGTRDGYVPFKNAEELVKQIPDAKLIPIVNGNHVLVLNNVKEICAAIKAF